MSQTGILGHNPAEEEVEWFSKPISRNENTGQSIFYFCPASRIIYTIFLDSTYMC